MTTPVVILAGGLGTRLREETEVKPKPMVEIGGKPILWHIMKLFSHFQHNEFYVCLGYKGEIIKEFFLDYHLKSHNLTIDLGSGEIDTHGDALQENWLVNLLDTGLETLTGGRVKRVAKHIGSRRFLMTYGDGVSDVDVHALLRFHEASGKLATVTAVRPPARFGGILIEDGLVRSFEEKPQIGEGWINGGFMVFEPDIIDYIEGDSTILERDPLERLAREGQLAAYQHDHYWQCMDTVRDVFSLREAWDSGRAPWKLW